MADDNQKQEDAQEQAQDAAGKAQDAAQKAEAAADKAEETAEEVKEEVKEIKEELKEEKAQGKEEAKASPKVSKKLEGVIAEIEKLSVLELSELVKALETKFGVSAAPQVVAGAAPAAASGEEATSEQTTFNVVLADSGANKISVIKAVRELVPTLGLKEAKDLVDTAPKQVLEGVNKETANEAKTKLETAGAKVELK
jgi:large subunit ribosomal protein L7/L12